MKSLKGTKTHDNLKAAFAGESQANRRYLYFAAKADVEGYNDVSAVFRSTAEGETGHAHGHLEYLEAVGDPATGLPIGATADNLKAAIAGETHEYTDMYPGMAKSARDEGFRRNRRLVRDPGQGRTLARQPFPEGAGHARQVETYSTVKRGRFCRPRIFRELWNQRDQLGINHRAARRTVLHIGKYKGSFHVRTDRRQARGQSQGAHPPSARLAESGIFTTRNRCTRS